jgi:acetylornithine/N-succinyldiaminopimelate aminotransferase
MEKEKVLTAGTTDYQQIDQQHYLQVFRRFPITLAKGEGSYVWDTEGKKYLDALAGIAVNSVGHCHPKVVAAIQAQAAQLIHISNIYTSVPQVQLAQKLAELSGLDRVFFTNSGAESVEGAFKLARKYAHKQGRGGTIISMEGCFHGRTLATIASGKAKYQQGFAPIPAGFKQVPFNDINAVSAAIDQDTSAVIVEPIQGEGGIHPAYKVYLQQLRKLCTEQNVVLIFDEIQCGMGRSGTFFAFQDYGVQPDIMTLAKALGSGVPVGAFLANEKVASAIDFGDHGTTFGGNPLACAAALATIAIIEEESLVEKAKVNGEKVLQCLQQAQEKEPGIVAVRGKGLMIGVELDFPGRTVVAKMMEKGVLGNCANENVMRLVPPLNMSLEDLYKIVEVLLEAIAEVKASQA